VNAGGAWGNPSGYPAQLGQGPSVSPWARWAGTAFDDTMIVTVGFVFDPV
jgi:hypothetical protein